MEIFVILLFVGVFSYAVACAAENKGRDPALWGILALVISPLLAAVILVCIGDANGRDE